MQMSAAAHLSTTPLPCTFVPCFLLMKPLRKAQAQWGEIAGVKTHKPSVEFEVCPTHRVLAGDRHSQSQASAAACCNADNDRARGRLARA